MQKLLHGEEREVLRDQAYWNKSHQQSAQAKGSATGSIGALPAHQ
jgi:hypothetical protein